MEVLKLSCFVSQLQRSKNQHQHRQLTVQLMKSNTWPSSISRLSQWLSQQLMQLNLP